MNAIKLRLAAFRNPVFAQTVTRYAVVAAAAVILFAIYGGK